MCDIFQLNHSYTRKEAVLSKFSFFVGLRVLIEDYCQIPEYHIPTNIPLPDNAWLTENRWTFIHSLIIYEVIRGKKIIQ